MGTDTQPQETVPELTSMDDMRAYLQSQHGVTVGPDDPVLLLHTMHRVFLGNYERLLERHHQALTDVIGEAVKGLTDASLREHLQAHIHLADRVAHEFSGQYRRARTLTWISLLSSAVCLPVLIYLIVK